MAGGYLNINPTQIGELPFREIDFSDKGQKASHDEIVKMVEQLCGLYKDAQSSTVQHRIDQTTARIAQLERGIDQLVFDLFGLTKEEQKLVMEE